MTAVFGTGREAGADEDDFHTFKRKNVEVDREVQSEEKGWKVSSEETGCFDMNMRNERDGFCYWMYRLGVRVVISRHNGGYIPVYVLS